MFWVYDLTARSYLISFSFPRQPFSAYKKPTTDYTVSGTTLNFVSAPAAAASIVVLHLGVGSQTTTTVADGAITQAKLSPDIDFGINALFFTGS